MNWLKRIFGGKGDARRYVPDPPAVAPLGEIAKHLDRCLVLPPTLPLAKAAACWLVLLEAGVAKVQDVIRWADAKIVETDKPDSSLIEISTAGVDAFYAVSRNLRALAGATDGIDALRYAVPTIRRAIEKKIVPAEQAAAFTYRYLSPYWDRVPKDMRYLFEADDEFYLARVEHYGDVKTVEQKFMAALGEVESRLSAP